MYIKSKYSLKEIIDIYILFGDSIHMIDNASERINLEALIKYNLLFEIG